MIRSVGRHRLIGALLALALATMPATSAASSSTATPPVGAGAPASAQGPDRPGPETIAVPEIARRAEEAGRTLRDIDATIARNAFVESLEQRLPGIEGRVAAQLEQTERQLATQPSGTILDGLAIQWQATRAEMGGYVNVLAQRATALEATITRLASMQDTWTRARADARASRAPAPVIERVAGVLAAIDDAGTRAQAGRAATLVSQDAFARLHARCEAVLQRIDNAERELTGRWFERDSAPVWRADELARTAADVPLQVRVAIGADVELLRQFVRDQGWKLPVQLTVFVALALSIRAARRRARVGAAGHVPAFEQPWSAALILTLLATPWLYAAPMPRAVTALAQVLSLGPALRIMRRLIDPALVPGLYIVGALFLADLVRHFSSVVPLLERQIFLIEMAACVAVLAWCVVFRRPRPSAAVAVSGEPASRAHAQWRPMAWIAAAALLVAFSVALIAGAAGYMRVALLIGGRVLGNGYLALVLYAGVRVGDGLVSLALRVRPLSHLGMVQRHRALLERRAQALLRWAAIAVGVVFALQLFGLWTRAVSVTAAVLGAELRRGAFAIAVEDVVVFTCTVAAAFLVSRVLRFTLEEDVYPRLRLGRGIPSALSGVIHYVLITVACLVGLRVLGVDLTKITILASAVGVGVGFGLQGVVNNFVSGMLLRFERKINVGDAVQVGDVAGEIQHVGMRACTVRTAEGAEVIVPNASLTTEKVTNWTLSDRRRRIDMKVGVAYGTHPEAVRGLMLELARAHKLVVEDPPPNALFLGFGDSALLFELRVWTDRFDMWVDIRSELYVALYDALQAADIQIPFPQHEVRVRHV